MRYENNADRIREQKAMDAFCSKFGGKGIKLGEWDIDFRYKGDDGLTKAYIEVKGRIRTMDEAWPLPVAARKIIKLSDKTINPIMIWACTDGIIYGRLEDIEGNTRWGGRKVREGSANDQEVMCYYNPQPGLKYIKY
jgi:hypothetical protein